MSRWSVNHLLPPDNLPLPLLIHTQAKKALETARLRRAAAEEAEKQAAALTLQCALRQWQASVNPERYQHDARVWYLEMRARIGTVAGHTSYG